MDVLVRIEAGRPARERAAVPAVARRRDEDVTPLATQPPEGGADA